MTELGKGIIFGFVLSLMIGPVFFALIQTSIEKGFRSGLFMAFGISLSDSLYIFITYSGISMLTNNNQIKIVLGIFGALIMILFGIHSILKPIPEKGYKRHMLNANNIFRKILKGFILNSINPFVFIFWLGVAGLVTIELKYSINQALVFYAGVIAMVLIADIAKSFLSHKLRDVVTPHFMKLINRVVGIVLIIFGARLFYYVFEIYHTM